MDPSLQEFYSLSRSTSIQQRPLSQADALNSRSSSRQQVRRPRSQQYQRPTSSIYAWPSSYHPFSVPSIAQISIPQPYRNSYQDNYAPEDGQSSHRRHHTATAGYSGSGASVPRPQSRGDPEDMILNDPLGASPTPMAVESSRYPFPEDVEAPGMGHLEDLDYCADYIPGVEGEGPRFSNDYDPNFHAQRRGSGDPRGDQGDEEHTFEQDHYSLQEEDLNRRDVDESPPEITPLPKIPLFVLSVVIFSEPLTSTILFPFVYFMVRDFHITENEEEIGFFCGLIASSFFFAQFCTSIFWGYMSDRYGRRPILLLGLIGSTIACLFFGLSKSLVWAITSRSMCGLLNGNVGVAKSMLGEIADSTNQSQAFSIFGFAWGIGMIIGPVLGGYLANPAQNFPDTFGQWPFFIKYPYFLPCFVAATGSVAGFTVGYFFLEETKGRKNLVQKEHYGPGQFSGQNDDQDFIPNGHQLQDQQRHDERDHIIAPFKTAGQASDAMEAGDLERQPLNLPPNATQPQQVMFANRRFMGASNQYGSMSTLAHEAGAISPTGSPYRGFSQTDYSSVSARSTLSRRPCHTRPSLFHQQTSGSGSTSGGIGPTFPSSYNDRHSVPFYSYSRPLSTGGLFSLADSSSLGPRGPERGIDIPADATLLTFGGYSNDPFLDARGGYEGVNVAADSNRFGRMSVAPSQVFLLPPDPNNKDPNQPIQLVVIQGPEAGLSPLSITTIVAYAMLALHSIVFEEVYTLYAVTPLMSHGLGWTAMQLSTSLATMGLAQLVLQFIVYPRLERRFSAVWLFRVAQLLYCCVYLTFPLIRQFAVDEDDEETGGQSRRVRTLVLIGLVLKYVCSVFSYTSVMVMITNSAPSHLLGTVNGIGQTSASFMRAFGPALGGILWAWSLSNKLEFPFNFFFVFFLMGTIALLGFIHSLSIPKELGRRRM
ncbi:hypothetical protein EMPS_09304 [Entomortierella parvispora]|uniref:Major facilitator superfamily (MFS) profile domain-containing protein n=1 Tax=Entomortierella parvispora TaxID=205924 RepID=A0A9P3M0G3_9FUNG|nr:hypothetical protein EMPS_09304 [Entomortierella parvispora]